MTEPVAEATLPPENPWPGLAAFEESWAHYFYGRNKATDALMRLIRRETATVLFGESGLGKTSLLQAGAAPKLREEGFLPIFIRMSFRTDAPPLRQQLLSAVIEAHQEADDLLKRLGPQDDAWCLLHHTDYPAVRDVDAPVPVLIFDQFEEFFSRRPLNASDFEEDGAFIEDLADLVENRPSADFLQAVVDDPKLLECYRLEADRYRLVFSLREDYLSHLAFLRRLAPALGRDRLRLEKMTGEAAVDAVIGPGRSLVDPSIAEEIVRFVGRESTADERNMSSKPLHAVMADPSLLSLFCRELNERRKEIGAAKIDSELLFDSRDTILTTFYERALEDQPDKVKRVIEEELISPDGAIRLDLPVVSFEQKTGSNAALPILVSRRILRIEDRQFRRVELIHDILVGVVADSRRARHEREQHGERQKAYRRTFLRAAGLAVALAILVMSLLLYRAQQSKNEAERLVFACAVSLAPPSDTPSDVLARYRMPVDIASKADECGSTLTQVLRKTGKSPGDIVAWWTLVSEINARKDPLKRADDLKRAITESGAIDAAAYRAQLAAAYSLLSSLYAQAGRRDLAQAAQGDAAREFKASKEAEKASGDMAALTHNLGQYSLEGGNFEDAKAKFQEALALRKQSTTLAHLQTGTASLEEREGLAREYAALGRTAAQMAVRDSAKAAALITLSDQMYELCRSSKEGPLLGLDRKSNSARLIQARCYVDQAAALQRIDTDRTRRLLVLALGANAFDLENVPPSDRESLYALLNSTADFDEAQLRKTPGSASERARIFRTWLVVARRDVFAVDPSRSNRDLLTDAMIKRAWYYLYSKNSKAAEVEADAATYLDRSNVRLKFVRGHAALLNNKQEKALTLYNEAAKLLGNRAKAVSQLRADFALIEQVMPGQADRFRLTLKAVSEQKSMSEPPLTAVTPASGDHSA